MDKGQFIALDTHIKTKDGSVSIKLENFKSS